MTATIQSAADPATYLGDIPLDLARAAHNGTSHVPQQRAEQERADYANTLARDYAMLCASAAESPDPSAAIEILDEEFTRYRDGYRKHFALRLSAMAKCLSTMIAGRSNFNTRRANKASDAADARTRDLLDYRERALKAIHKAIRPDLAPIAKGDADAAERLREKIAEAEKDHARMKEVNAVIKKFRGEGAIAPLIALGFTDGGARNLIKPDFMGRVGFPSYALSNHSAEIRRLKARLEEVEKAQNAPVVELVGTVAQYEDNPADNRVRVFYPGKPDAKTIARLKQNGFRWTPSLGCWQAYRNTRALMAAKEFAGVVEVEQPPVLADAAGSTETPAPECCDHWHCNPAEAPHMCDAPDRTKPCPTCKIPPPAFTVGFAAGGPRCGCKVNAPEADPSKFACPCGDHCTDVECVTFAKRIAEGGTFDEAYNELRYSREPVGHFVPAGGMSYSHEDTDADLSVYSPNNEVASGGT